MVQRHKQFKPNEAGFVAGLIRKSAIDYPPEILSPEERVRYVESLIEVRIGELVNDAARDGETIDRFYVDMNVSGGAESKRRRKGLNEYMEDAEKRHVRLTYARDMSRVYRDTIESLLFIRDMERLGVEVRARGLANTGDRANDNLQNTIIFAIDAHQREKTGQDIKRRNESLVRIGRWCGYSRDTWGLRYDHEALAMRIDPATLDRAVFVFEVFVECLGIARPAARRLNDLYDERHARATLRPNGQYWQSNNVLRVIRSSAYRRIAKWGDVERYAPELIDESIPPELVARADQLLREREPVGWAIRHAGPARTTFSGMLRCGHCGGPMHTSRTDREHGLSISWICTLAHQRRANCPDAHMFKQERMEALLYGALADMIATVGQLQISPGSPKPRPPDKDDAAQRIVGIDNEMRRLIRLASRHADMEQVVEEEIEALRRQRARVAGESTDKLEVAAKPVTHQFSAAQWQALAQSVDSILQADTGQKLHLPTYEFLRSLGVGVHITIAERTFTRQKEARTTSRRFGGLMTLRIESSVLGYVGGNAYEVTETMEQHKQSLSWLYFPR